MTRKRSKLREDDANLLLSVRLLFCSVICCSADREENFCCFRKAGNICQLLIWSVCLETPEGDKKTSPSLISLHLATLWCFTCSQGDIFWCLFGALFHFFLGSGSMDLEL